MQKFSVLIPAFNPGNELIDLVDKLLKSGITDIVVVNDGSNKSCANIFSTIQGFSSEIILLEHATNLGKGAALKTGLNYISTHFFNHVGVVTADADGQHLVEDILRVGDKLLHCPNDLIMGVREFNNTEKKVPLRSKMGNLLTVKLFKLIIGQRVSDTQSGLRGIPLGFIPTLLTISSDRYEFELNMLISCKYANRNIQEVAIKTVYIDNNKGSHFNPILDSFRIYFVLFRFTLLSLMTFILDFAAFVLLSSQGFNILTCQIISRCVGVMFNYPIAKKMVFHCGADSKYPFIKYITLVAINGMISFLFIDFFVTKHLLKPAEVKILVESLLFLANFAIQRDFIFTKRTAYEY